MSNFRSLIRAVASSVVTEAVRARRAGREHEKLKPVFQDIDQALLDGIKVLSTREIMVEKMPKGGIVAEIGGSRGQFFPPNLEARQSKETLSY